MYTPYRGGLFAQHAWNEVYMGEAGWIPVDSTLREFDFVDSGHLRLGVVQSTATGMNARRVEILDFRTAPAKGILDTYSRSTLSSLNENRDRLGR